MLNLESLSLKTKINSQTDQDGQTGNRKYTILTNNKEL